MDKINIQPGLNLISLLRSDLEESIIAASEAGFEHVELWVDSLERYLGGHSADELRRLLVKYGMQVSSIGDIESITFCTADQCAQLRARCARIAAVAREIGCPTVVVSGSVKPRGIDPISLSREIRSALGQLSDVVEDEGAGLAVAIRGFSWCSINSLGQARDVVESFTDRKIGLAVDTFDLHAAGGTPQSLESLDPEDIYIMRLSDCADIPPPLLTEAARVLPGEGKAELGAMLERLVHTGFSKPVFVKAISPRLLEVAPRQLAQTAMAAAQAHLAAVAERGKGIGS